MAVAEIKPQLEESWLKALENEFNQPYFGEIKQSILTDKQQGISVYPPGSQLFNAFNSAPFNKVKVVIIGQDPYHGPNQAHGLCFSVQSGVKPPPSLVNIYKELHSDLNLPIPTHGNLQSWANQGVLLLNAILSVRANQPASHSKIGWQQFTDTAIKQLSIQREGLVFLLWGRFAQNKAELIDATKHHILKAAHPSPFSAYNGFFGCKHFSKANDILSKQGLSPIDWQV